MAQKSPTKAPKKSRFHDLADDFPVRPLEADEEPVFNPQPRRKDITKEAAVAESSEIPNGQQPSVSPTAASSDIADNPPNVLGSIKPTLEDLVVIPEIDKNEELSVTPVEPAIQSRNEIKRVIEATSPAPTRTREKDLRKAEEDSNSTAPAKQTDEKPLAGSFEIPDEEKLDKGYHFYCNERVLDKVRRYAKQKNITISKLITTILDKAIKEE